jgi:RNA polymerase sigma factor (sigma-70 family)
MPDLHWDQHCITRHLAGEPEAFEELYSAHAGQVKAYFLRSGFDAAMADDCTQQTFLNVFGAMDRFDSARGGFHTWLRTIANNVCRKRWRKRSFTEEVFDPELADVMLHDDTDPDEMHVLREELAALEQCAEHLPEDAASLIRLRYVDALTTRAIAERLGVPESTVRMRLGQAKDMLLACMSGKGFFE